MLLVDTQMKTLRRPAALSDFLHCQDGHLGDIVDALRSDWLLKVGVSPQGLPQVSPQDVTLGFHLRLGGMGQVCGRLGPAKKEAASVLMSYAITGTSTEGILAIKPQSAVLNPGRLNPGRLSCVIRCTLYLLHLPERLCFAIAVPPELLNHPHCCLLPQTMAMVESIWPSEQLAMALTTPVDPSNLNPADPQVGQPPCLAHTALNTIYT